MKNSRNAVKCIAGKETSEYLWSQIHLILEQKGFLPRGRVDIIFVGFFFLKLC